MGRRLADAASAWGVLSRSRVRANQLGSWWAREAKAAYCMGRKATRVRRVKDSLDVDRGRDRGRVRRA
jgi:hypothetical protein